MSSIANITVIALGGAIGSCLRYGVGHIEQISSKGLGTFVVNVLGCFFIGVLYALFTRWEFAEHWRLFLFVGLLGGFTTFSSFALDAVTVMQSAGWMKMILYVAATNVFGILSAVAGMRIMMLCLK